MFFAVLCRSGCQWGVLSVAITSSASCRSLLKKHLPGELSFGCLGRCGGEKPLTAWFECTFVHRTRTTRAHYDVLFNLEDCSAGREKVHVQCHGIDVCFVPLLRDGQNARVG